MNKYQNGKIYKLVCDNSPLVYYGSTIQSLNTRLTHHKHQYNTCSSKELFDLGNVSIVLVEDYPCNSKYELESRERIYIQFMLNNFNHRICNKIIPTRTPQEWRLDNREWVFEYYRVYNQDHQEALNEKKRVYYQENKEALNEKKKVYYQENKEEINEKARRKFNCECGGRYTMRNKSAHFKTKKHQVYINNL